MEQEHITFTPIAEAVPHLQLKQIYLAVTVLGPRVVPVWLHRENEVEVLTHEGLYLGLDALVSITMFPLPKE